MELKVGTVVKSMAGHDKGDIQVVISFDKNVIMVCDGKRRKIEYPKKKNIKHVEVTNTIIDGTSLLSNSSIRKSLGELRIKAN